MSESNGSAPVLWHLRFSHYNEKARWALDYKGIAHERRASLPVLHAIRARLVAKRDRTLPILVLNGDVVQGSDKIIDALERHKPEPALYPSDEAGRERALELQRYLDTELGPHLRRFAFFHILPGNEDAPTMMSQGFSPRTQKRFKTAYPLVRAVMRRAMNINAKSAERSRIKLLGAMDRLDAEIGPSGYLVGESFSVADLAGASLLFPLVRPSVGMQSELPDTFAAPLEEFRTSVADRPSFKWVEEMYRRHRGTSASINGV